ncbi:hypothetical protein CK203_081223 [Vitis vinifera]|uniref:Uncharacterized protein n=1 Tax=Vitis vinifera TaxID=29760 RepID=A0A438ERM5_VITVI|nr:hypothetical protein CK203_081223 [Vitis vinifera]
MVRILSRGTSTASVLTRRELPSGMLLIDVLLRANLFSLQHKKVHHKKLQRADGIPLLFPRLLCQILEHLGYPEEPRLERRRHCREDFSLGKWHHLVSYFAPQGAPTVPAPPKLPRDGRYLRPSRMRFSQRHHLLPLAAHPSEHIPEPIHPISPITSGAPPVVPATPAPPPSSEPTITMATIRAHQDQIIATQAQHTTILHQIQQHLSMHTPLGHDRSAPSEPLVPDEESLPAEQPILEEEIRAEPSHDPTHI